MSVIVADFGQGAYVGPFSLRLDGTCGFHNRYSSPDEQRGEKKGKYDKYEEDVMVHCVAKLHALLVHERDEMNNNKLCAFRRNFASDKFRIV